MKNYTNILKWYLMIPNITRMVKKCGYLYKITRMRDLTENWKNYSNEVVLIEGTCINCLEPSRNNWFPKEII